MDLQGNLDRKFTVTWRWAATPQRPKDAEIWPASSVENMARLAEGGEPIDVSFPSCICYLNPLTQSSVVSPNATTVTSLDTPANLAQQMLSRFLTELR